MLGSLHHLTSESRGVINTEWNKQMRKVQIQEVRGQHEEQAWKLAEVGSKCEVENGNTGP